MNPKSGVHISHDRRYVSQGRSMQKLEQEALDLKELLKDKTVSNIVRHNEKELLIEFSDGTRFFVNSIEEKLDLSVTSN